VLQSTPGFLSVFGIKPNLLIGSAICLAMFEGEFVGGLYGALAGMLLDLGSSRIFGFYSILLFIFCIGAGLAVIYLLHLTWINALMMTWDRLGHRTVGLLHYLGDVGYPAPGGFWLRDPSRK
jgi:cell shape-determining protein MreD